MFSFVYVCALTVATYIEHRMMFLASNKWYNPNHLKSISFVPSKKDTWLIFKLKICDSAGHQIKRELFDFPEHLLTGTKKCNQQ